MWHDFHRNTGFRNKLSTDFINSGNCSRKYLHTSPTFNNMFQIIICMCLFCVGWGEGGEGRKKGEDSSLRRGKAEKGCGNHGDITEVQSSKRETPGAREKNRRLGFEAGGRPERHRNQRFRTLELGMGAEAVPFSLCHAFRKKKTGVDYKGTLLRYFRSTSFKDIVVINKRSLARTRCFIYSR